MKMPRSFCFFILLVAMTSCQSNRSNCCDEVVCETVHRYGVSLQPEDWSDRGQNGTVVSMRKDGVTVARTYEAGVLHGDCTYTFPHRDVIQKKEVFNQGALVNAFTYYPNGLPQQQTTYESPTRQSLVVWYENGAPQSREEIENGNLVCGDYYNTHHQIESRVDESNGFRTRRDGMGQMQSLDTIQDGQMVLRTTYHPNGTPDAFTPYVNGVVEGQRRTFHVGGEPATVEDWAGNVQHGTTTVYEHGEKWADVPYVNGCKHGVERRYRDEQTVAQEITWAQGQQHGPSYSYIGNSTQTDWYFRDRQVPNKATFDVLSNQ
jgi:antitoxin component YwqK of YwqJK toxin-antitoxin module